MTPRAILFGAIGTLTESSEMQRQAFNAAFAEAGLDWTWEPQAYNDMLRQPGGKARIERYAAQTGEDVDADALHAAKVGHFERLVNEQGLYLRPGVAETIGRAKAQGIAIGFATTTSPSTVGLILHGLMPALTRSDFDFIGDRTQVPQAKPAPHIYKLALKRLGISAREAVAIEDTPESAQAALAAGIRTLVVPGEAARHRDVPTGATRHPVLDPADVFSDIATAAE